MMILALVASLSSLSQAMKPVSHEDFMRSKFSNDLQKLLKRSASQKRQRDSLEKELRLMNNLISISDEKSHSDGLKNAKISRTKVKKQIEGLEEQQTDILKAIKVRNAKWFLSMFTYIPAEGETIRAERIEYGGEPNIENRLWSIMAAKYMGDIIEQFREELRTFHQKGSKSGKTVEVPVLTVFKLLNFRKSKPGIWKSKRSQYNHQSRKQISHLNWKTAQMVLEILFHTTNIYLFDEEDIKYIYQEYSKYYRKGQVDYKDSKNFREFMISVCDQPSEEIFNKIFGKIKKMMDAEDERTAEEINTKRIPLAVYLWKDLCENYRPFPEMIINCHTIDLYFRNAASSRFQNVLSHVPFWTELEEKFEKTKTAFRRNKLRQEKLVNDSLVKYLENELHKPRPRCRAMIEEIVKNIKANDKVNVGVLSVVLNNIMD